MARFVSEERYRHQAYQGDPRSSPAEFHLPGSYRFARLRGKSARAPLHRIYGSLRRVIEAIVDSKLRRMERELELRGIQTRNLR